MVLTASHAPPERPSAAAGMPTASRTPPDGMACLWPRKPKKGNKACHPWKFDAPDTLRSDRPGIAPAWDWILPSWEYKYSIPKPR